MRANGKKPFMEEIFLLLFMTTLVVMTTTVKLKGGENQLQGQHQDERQNKTEGSIKMGIPVNETEENLTLDFNSGDLAFEREHSRHELIITEVGNFSDSRNWRYLECRGENIKSLSAISCDTLESCEENKSLLFEQKKCLGRSSWRGNCWGECSSDAGRTDIYRSGSRFSYMSDEDTEESGSSCLRVEISLFSRPSGVVQCTSEENGVKVTTFDHYTVSNANATLLSKFTNVTSDLIQMKLYVRSLSAGLNTVSDSVQNNKTTNANSSVTLFVGEEVTLLECKVPKLLFHKDGLLLRAHMKDGLILELGPKMTYVEYSGKFMKLELGEFRVSEDVIAFSCSAQRTNSSDQWLKSWINVTVQDLPSKLLVNTTECRNMTVDLTSGSKVNLHCELTGPLERKTSVKDQMRKMRYNFQSEVSSKSVVEFLRFYQVAGEHLICQEMDLYESYENSTWKTEHEKLYGVEQRFHFLFNLAPAAPKIHNPNTPTSSVHLIYHEDHIVDQTLLCLFNGEPQPVITWMKNGQKFISGKSLEIRHEGNETLEHVKLRLDSKTIQQSDFYDLSENGSAKAGHVNFSCVASNFFGSDRLDFIITLTGASPSCTETFETTTKTRGTTKTSPLPDSTISAIEKREDGNSSSSLTLNLDRTAGSEASKRIAIIVTSFFALSFMCILGFSILWKKRAAVARAVESRRVFSFRNLVQNERSESMQNVLTD